MFKILSLIMVGMVVILQGCAHPHTEAQKDDKILGEHAIKRESDVFHQGIKRIKSEFRHVHFTKDQTVRINDLLGRKASAEGVLYQRIYKSLPGRPKAAFLGRLYKLEMENPSGNLVALLEVMDGKLREIKVVSENPSVDSSRITEILSAHFENHSLDNISLDIASLKDKGWIGEGCGLSPHVHHTTQEEYKENMRMLKELEEKYSLLSLIQECLAMDSVIY